MTDSYCKYSQNWEKVYLFNPWIDRIHRQDLSPLDRASLTTLSALASGNWISIAVRVRAVNVTLQT